jgi:hypothetical protein
LPEQFGRARRGVEHGPTREQLAITRIQAREPRAGSPQLNLRGERVSHSPDKSKLAQYDSVLKCESGIQRPKYHGRIPQSRYGAVPLP